MDDDGSGNRRRGERVPVNSEFIGGARTYVSDLSEQGVFLHTRERLPIGTQIELRFTLLLDDPVTVQALGTVMRHQEQPMGLGIQFGPLSPATVLRIHDAISRKRPRELGAPVPAPADQVPARGVATRAISEDARTGRWVALDGADLTHLVESEDAEASDDQTTLVNLRPVGLPVADDDEPDEGGVS